MTLPETRQSITDLFYESAHCIDTDRLEEWIDFFTDDGVYKIVPKENYDRGLPAVIVWCDNKDMLRDRIVSLRNANIYNFHTDRHIIGNIRFLSEDAGVHAVESNYALYQTDPEGESRLFSVGIYMDKVVFLDGAAKFKERIVIVDTCAVHSMVSTPI